MTYKYLFYILILDFNFFFSLLVLHNNKLNGIEYNTLK